MAKKEFGLGPAEFGGAGMTLTEPEIRDFLKERLSAIERPAQYEFRDVLPKTMIGKLSKKELKAEEETKRT